MEQSKGLLGECHGVDIGQCEDVVEEGEGRWRLAHMASQIRDGHQRLTSLAIFFFFGKKKIQVTLWSQMLVC
jgi:hypothetical protein